MTHTAQAKADCKAEHTQHTLMRKHEKKEGPTTHFHAESGIRGDINYFSHMVVPPSRHKLVELIAAILMSSNEHGVAFAPKSCVPVGICHVFLDLQLRRFKCLESKLDEGKFSALTK